jgi:hypothetical protein
MYSFSIIQQLTTHGIDLDTALIIDGFGLKTCKGIVELELPSIEYKDTLAYERDSRFICRCKENISACNEARLYTSAVNSESPTLNSYNDWFQEDEFKIELPKGIESLDNFVYLKNGKWCSLGNYAYKAEFLGNYKLRSRQQANQYYHIYPMVQLVDRYDKLKKFSSVITITLNIRENPMKKYNNYTLMIEVFTVYGKEDWEMEYHANMTNLDALKN